ncbi:MAG: hydroxyacid dehydrogenase [Bacteroidales bacterium]|jgi:D-3-phosphoglycerate dehydrogenase|nr:hydroxyacid dehydrogenase [Bacteroidales bacterium]
MKITAIEPIGISTERYLDIKNMFAQKGHSFLLYADRKEDEPTIVERMKDADIAIISNIPLTKNVLAQCPKLKLLAVAFTGLDHIDTAYCAERGIEVVNANGYATVAVAELAVGLMLDVYRKITFMDSETRNHSGRGSFLGRQLKDKTVGIIGTGAIGLETARILSAFGCKIIAYSRTIRKQATEIGVTYMCFEDVMRQADIISLHLPLTTETNLLIDSEKLNLCKTSSIFINTARGKIVDNIALAKALINGKIAGAGVDVFESEPPLTTHPLFSVPNCILTPHIAFATQESFSERIDIVINNINCWLHEKTISK